MSLQQLDRVLATNGTTLAAIRSPIWGDSINIPIAIIDVTYPSDLTNAFDTAILPLYRCDGGAPRTLMLSFTARFGGRD